MAFYIPPSQPRETWGQTIGQGLGRGLEAGLNMKLNEMLEDKKSERIARSNAAANKQIFSVIPGLQHLAKQNITADPDTILKYLQYEDDRGGLALLRKGHNAVVGQKNPGRLGESIHGGKNPNFKEKLVSQQSIRNTLPPGVPPMLNASDMPETQQGLQNNVQDEGQLLNQNENPEEDPVQEARSSLRELENVYKDMPESKYKDSLYKDIKSQRAAIRAEEMAQTARETLKFKKESKNQEYINDIYKDVVKKNQELGSASKHSLPTYTTALRQNEKMKTGPATWDAIVSSLGPPWNNFKTENAQKLEAQTPEFIVAFKDKMGGVLTEAKIKLIAQKTIGLGKDKNVNRMIAYMGWADKKLDSLKDKFQDEIIAKNQGRIPADFKQRLESKMKPYQKQIQRDIDDVVLRNKKPNSSLAQEAYNEFSDRPDALLHKGESIRDTDTNKLYYSDGKTWKEIQK